MATKRRPLDLRSLDDVIAEVERLRDGGYRARGRWNLSQMADHLVETMRLGMDGDEPRLAWPMQKLVGLLFRTTVFPRRTMMTGAPTIDRLKPAPMEGDDPAKLDRLVATLEEARDFPGPLPPYPLMDGLTLPEWKELMTIHAQHHLRFLEPAA